jgi:hypothetical protein
MKATVIRNVCVGVSIPTAETFNFTDQNLWLSTFALNALIETVGISMNVSQTSVSAGLAPTLCRSPSNLRRDLMNDPISSMQTSEEVTNSSLSLTDVRGAMVTQEAINVFDPLSFSIMMPVAGKRTRAFVRGLWYEGQGKRVGLSGLG